MTIARNTYSLPFLLTGVACLALFFFLPQSAFAQGIFNSEGRFIPIAGIPGFSNYTGQDGMAGLVNALYRIAIVVGALAAVIKITVAGVKYMGTDLIGSKGEAKEDIKAALVGLLILLSTVLILKTIFGDINLDVLRNLKPVDLPDGQGPVDPNAPPPSPQRPVDASWGCNQGTFGGNSCATGYTAQIGPNGWNCILAGQTPTPYAGQTTFRPMTNNECSSAVGTVIQNGGKVYGHHSITRNELQAKYPGKSVSEAMSLYTAELNTQCRSMSQNPNAKITSTGWAGSQFSNNTLGFTCTS